MDKVTINKIVAVAFALTIIVFSFILHQRPSREEFNQEIDEKTIEIADLKKSLNTTKTTLTNLEEEKKTLEEELKDKEKITKDLEQAKKDLVKKEEQISKLKKEITTLENQIKELSETYFVSFVADGEVLASYEVKKGDNVLNVPSIPSKNGYTSSWSSSTKNIQKNMVITAKYTPVNYKITYILSTDTYEYKPNENNKFYIETIDETFYIDFTNNVIKNEDETVTYKIEDNKFTVNSDEYKIIKDLNIIYNSTSSANLKKTTFSQLPTSYKYGQIISIDNDPKDYVYNIDITGKPTTEELNVKVPTTWIVKGDAQTSTNNSKLLINAKGNIYILVKYTSEN